MYQTIQLMPGVTLRCVEDHRFKQGCLSIQLVRPMSREEAAMNALLPAVLLRGTVRRPDLRAITMHLDDLYGASVGEMVRRIGDYQTVGLYFSFIEDRFALSGDQILEPMLDFARELLLEPVTENGGFSWEYVSGEKRNLIANIESQLNDKRAYAATRLMEHMCKADSYGIPRLGTKEQVAAIDPVVLYDHYRRILRESPVEVFYVGSADPQLVSNKVCRIFQSLERSPIALPEHTPFADGGGADHTETMEISQGKLCMGFLTPVTWDHRDYAAMQVFNALFGSGMTSKLFVHIREKLSLCYFIGSGYYGSKGIVTVSAGIDSDKYEQVREHILQQLRCCQEEQITSDELTAAKEALLSAMDGVYDSPGAIESFEFSMAMGKAPMSLETYRERVCAVTAQQVAQVAKTLTLHTTYFLKGVDQ